MPGSHCGIWSRAEEEEEESEGEEEEEGEGESRISAYCALN